MDNIFELKRQFLIDPKNKRLALRLYSEILRTGQEDQISKFLYDNLIRTNQFQGKDIIRLRFLAEKEPQSIFNQIKNNSFFQKVINSNTKTNMDKALKTIDGLKVHYAGILHNMRLCFQKVVELFNERDVRDLISMNKEGAAHLRNFLGKKRFLQDYINKSEHDNCHDKSEHDNCHEERVQLLQVIEQYEKDIHCLQTLFVEFNICLDSWFKEYVNEVNLLA